MIRCNICLPSRTRSGVQTCLTTRASRHPAHSLVDPRASSKNLARVRICRLPLPSAMFSNTDRLASSRCLRIPRKTSLPPTSPEPFRLVHYRGRGGGRRRREAPRKKGQSTKCGITSRLQRRNTGPRSSVPRSFTGIGVSTHHSGPTSGPRRRPRLAGGVSTGRGGWLQHARR